MTNKYFSYEGKEKTKLFRANFPFYPIPKQNDRCLCIHCEKDYKIKDLQVNKSVKGDIWIMCRDYPKCNGSVIDIMYQENSGDDLFKRIDLGLSPYGIEKID
jgi:ssDNA-binding Zn-finger/Zn-ribbon topoisomerase 1